MSNEATRILEVKEMSEDVKLPPGLARVKSTVCFVTFRYRRCLFRSH